MGGKPNAKNAIDNVMHLGVHLSVPVDELVGFLGISDATFWRWRALGQDTRFPRKKIQRFLGKLIERIPLATDPDHPAVQALYRVGIEDFGLEPELFREQIKGLVEFRDAISNICLEDVVDRPTQELLAQRFGKKAFSFFLPDGSPLHGSREPGAVRKCLLWVAGIDDRGLECFLFYETGFMRGGIYKAKGTEILDLIFARRIVDVSQFQDGVSYTNCFGYLFDKHEGDQPVIPSSRLNGVILTRGDKSRRPRSHPLIVEKLSLPKQLVQRLHLCSKMYRDAEFEKIFEIRNLLEASGFIRHMSDGGTAETDPDRLLFDRLKSMFAVYSASSIDALPPSDVDNW